MEPLNNCHQFFQSRGIPKEFVAFTTDDYLGDYSEALWKSGVVNPQFFYNLQDSLNLVYLPNKVNVDGYVLQGCNGCGKTGWASALIREALLQGINSLMISMPGMIDEYYNSPTKKLNSDYAQSQSSTSRDNHCYKKRKNDPRNFNDFGRNPLHRGIIIVI